MSSDDEARRGLVDLAVLARYRLVNLTAAVAGGNVAPCDPRQAGQLVLAAWCDRPHNDGHTGGGPYLIAVCDNADNLAELAWAATSHEADLHDGDGPYLRWEVGAGSADGGHDDQPSPREVLNQVAERLLVLPRARIVNRVDRDAITLADALRVIEDTAAALASNNASGTRFSAAETRNDRG